MGGWQNVLVLTRAAGVDESNIGDADKAENVAHITGCVIPVRAKRYAAGCEHHDGALAGEQADGAGFGVPECFAGAHDLVDPCLEGCGYGKVVNRQADYKRVGGAQLVHQHVRSGKGVFLFVGAITGRGKVGADPAFINQRQRRRQITGDDIGRTQAGDNAVGQFARDRPGSPCRCVNT